MEDFSRWRSGATAPVEPATLTNNSSLQLVGQSKLRTHDITLWNSSVTMDNNTRLDVIYNTELNNSTATIASGAALNTNTLIAKGNSTVSLGVNGRLNTATLDIRDGATTTVAANDYDIGEMTVSSQVLFSSSGTGTLVVGNLQAVLNLSNNATMDVTSHATLSNNGEINQQESLVTVRQGSTVKNNVEWTVQSVGTLLIAGNATIGQDSGQHGHIDMQGTLAFSGSGNNTLNTSNELNLGSTAILQMTIDATDLTSDEILIDSSREFTISNNATTLSLNVINDTTIALGTKFLLINYPDWQGGMGPHFRGMTEGSSFSLGLNTYQINYNDGDYRPAEGSTFITLTTVPEPSTYALLGLAALAFGLRSFPRRGRV